MFFGGRFLIVALFMSSWSGGLYFFSFLITERISPDDIGDTGSAISGCDKINYSTRKR